MRSIKLLQVGQTNQSENYSVFSAGILCKKMSVSLAERTASPITTIFSADWDEDLSSAVISIGGVSFEGLILSEVNSIAELYLQPSSFFFDFNNQNLYIALPDYNNIIIRDIITLGETIGFISEAQLEEINGINYPLNTFIGSVFYEPRLTDISVVNTINDQKHGIFVFESMSVGIANADGKYDSIRDDITGNAAELLVANISDSPEEAIETGFPYKLAAEAGDFKVVRRGVVEDVDYSDPSNPIIRAIDARANWTQKIGVNLLTQTEFSGMPDEYVNDRKTLLIGTVNGSPCIPLRAEGVAADFDYFITDTAYGNIQSISQVYFKGTISATEVDRFLTGGEYSVNLTTGILTVSNVEKGEAWAYGVFTTMSETVEIILFLLATFDLFAYIASNFNINEVEQIRALDYQTHVNITGDGEQLFKVIEKLCADIQVDMFQQGSVLSMRQANVQGLVREAIPNYQIIANPPPWLTDRTDTIKTVTVKYNKDYRTDLWNTYYNDDNEDEALTNNRKAIDQPFDTNLVLVADVTAVYTTYYERFINVPRFVTLDRTIPYSVGVSDFISFPVIRKTLDGEKTIFVDGIYKVVSINTIDNTVDAVYFSDAPEDPVLQTLSYDSLSYTFISGRG